MRGDSLLSRRAVNATGDPVERYARRIAEASDALRNEGGVVVMGHGAPYDPFLPAEDIHEDLRRQAVGKWPRINNYGDAQGHPSFMEAVARVSGSDPAHVVATHGGSHAITLGLEAVVDPGDRVLVSGPTFPLVLSEVKRLGGIAVNVEADNYGVNPYALGDAIAEHNPAAVFLIPDFDATGVQMPPERRQAVARQIDSVRGMGPLLIEDQAYVDLNFDAPTLPSICSMLQNPAKGYLAKSYSKIWGPGDRIGAAVIGSAVLRGAVVDIIKSQCMQASPSKQAVVGLFINDGYLDVHKSEVLPHYRERRDALVHAMADNFPPDSDIALRTVPRGGMFGWVDGPDSLSSVNLFHEALQRGVGIMPGPIFYPEANKDEALSGFRLNFGSVPVISWLREGVKRAASAVPTSFRTR